jgi:hypothetical protein
MEMSGQLYTPAALPPGKDSLVPTWVDPRAGLDAVVKSKFSNPCCESKPGREARDRHYTDWAILAPTVTELVRVELIVRNEQEHTISLTAAKQPLTAFVSTCVRNVNQHVKTMLTSHTWPLLNVRPKYFIFAIYLERRLADLASTAAQTTRKFDNRNIRIKSILVRVTLRLTAGLSVCLSWPRAPRGNHDHTAICSRNDTILVVMGLPLLREDGIVVWVSHVSPSRMTNQLTN